MLPIIVVVWSGVFKDAAASGAAIGTKDIAKYCDVIGISNDI